MIVSNLYLKLLNKNKIAIIVYIVIFTILTLVMINSNKGVQDRFKNVKINIAYIDNDNTEFSNNLKDYISDYAEIKNIEKSNLDDAFFYRDIEMIIEIPKGFTSSFFDGNNPKIETKIIPESAKSVTLQRAIDKYLNLTRVYLENDISTNDLHEVVKTVLSKEAKVNISAKVKDDYTSLQFYYNYLAYILMALLITVIGSIMISIKPIEIKRRNGLGSISNNKMNMILLLCNFIFGIVLLILFIIISYILYPDIMIKTNGLLFMLNSFIFLLTVISLAYLLVVLFKSGYIIGALATVFSLGSSFLTGIFIPQFLLDDVIIKISKILPSYWYVKANDNISTLIKYNSTALKPVYTSFLMQIIFTIIFIVLALFISKYKQREEN